MNRRIILLSAAALVLPVLLRFIWFFPGLFLPRTIATPDYAGFKMPQAPLSTPAPVKAVSGGAASGAVLIDYAHANQFQPAEIQSLTDALTQRGGQFVLDSGSDTLADHLKSATSYVVISPSTAFTAEDLALVEAFVARGGRLVVFTDATRGAVQYDFLGNPVSSQPDANVANPLLEPYGIMVNSDYLYNLGTNEGNFRNVFLGPSAQSDLTAGIGKVIFYGAHSLETRGGSALLAGGTSTLSSSTDALPLGATQQGWPAAVLSHDGNVLALGDFSFLAPPYDAVADNGLLISHIADFLLAGPRQPALADYPYLFRSGSVNLLKTSDLQMTAEMTGMISGLQSALAASGVQLKLVQAAPSKGDLIVLGTYTPTDDLKSFVKPFGVTADGFGEFVTVPPFGKIGQSGNGLLLFRPGPNGNTLVVLASSVDDITTLLEDLGNADLSGCVLQGNVAACSIGIGGSFLETTPTPEATPTAGG